MTAGIVGSVLIASAAVAVEAAEPGGGGPRPYELDWAGRTADDHAPLIDFEELFNFLDSQHVVHKRTPIPGEPMPASDSMNFRKKPPPKKIRKNK